MDGKEWLTISSRCPAFSLISHLQKHCLARCHGVFLSFPSCTNDGTKPSAVGTRRQCRGSAQAMPGQRQQFRESTPFLIHRKWRLPISQMRCPFCRIRPCLIQQAPSTARRPIQKTHLLVSRHPAQLGDKAYQLPMSHPAAGMQCPDPGMHCPNLVHSAVVSLARPQRLR